MVYGVTVQTLGRAAGNGMTMLFVEATDPLTAEARVLRIAQRATDARSSSDHPVPCPGFSPTAGTAETDGS